MSTVQDKLDFIESYKRAQNAATGSAVDSNANVTVKNVATMFAEVPKADMIELNRTIVRKYLKEIDSDLIGHFDADLKNHIIYSHDESSIYPYTYSSKEVINVRYRGQLLLLSFDQLYNLVEDEEILLDEEKNVYGKFPSGMQIRDKEGWTNVTRLIRKERHRDLVRVKTSFGEDIVVTDNHPIIISDNVEDTIAAIDGIGHQQYKMTTALQWNECQHISLETICKPKILETYESVFTAQPVACGRIYSSPKTVEITEELGYFVGFFIGDGAYLTNDEYHIQIAQKERSVLEKLANIAVKYFNALPVIRYDDSSNKFNLDLYSVSLAMLLRNHFKIGCYAQNKTLPINILETNKAFAKGVIWGLVDSDGTCGDGTINIRISSRAGINQMCWLLKDFGFTVGTTMQESKVGFEGQIQKGYTQNYTIWGVSATVRDQSQLSEYSFKAQQIKVNNKHLKYSDGWVDITDVKVLKPGRFIDEQNEYIYDITTDSHSFICNNLWVHNCVAVSLYPYLLEGLKPLGGTSGAPKHSDSFIGGLTNLIFLIAGQFAGAVAVPETLPYLDHFLRVDYGDDYTEHLDEVVESFGNRRYTLRKKVEDLFQQFVYCVNQPAAARGY